MTDEQNRNKDGVREHFAALTSGNYAALDRIHDPAGRNHAHAPFDLTPWPAEGMPLWSARGP